MIVARAIALALALSLPSIAAAEAEYDDYGLVPDGGADNQWAEPSVDGHRPEPIAPDEAELDPFDERIIELEPEVRIAPDYRDDAIPPPPSRENPEPLLPPVEQLLREGPIGDPEKLDPTGPEVEEKKAQADEADPQEW